MVEIDDKLTDKQINKKIAICNHFTNFKKK